MIWSKFCVFMLTVAFVQSDGNADEYLVFTVKDSKGFSLFYKIGFDLTNLKFLARTANFSASIDKLHLSSNVLYWSYKKSDVIGRLDMAGGKEQFISIPEAKTGTFVGLGHNDKLYFHSPESRKLTVYDNNFDATTRTKIEEKLIMGLENVHFMSLNPCRKNWIYFIHCSTNITDFIFDLEHEAVASDYFGVNPPECFDSWSITPNGEKRYVLQDAGKGSILQESIKLEKFETFHNEKRGKVNSFAAGNNELFYSIGSSGYITKFVKNGKNGKSPKITARRGDISGEVTAMIVHQPTTTECWSPNEQSNLQKTTPSA